MNNKINQNDIIEFLEEKFPLNKAQKWDFPGYSLKLPNKIIKKVLVCLDVNYNVMERAIKEKIDLMHENIKPISRFMTFISKPFGFLIFIIGLILASITITNVTNNIINYYNNNNKSETPQQK